MPVGHPLLREEIFGPVSTLEGVDGDDELLMRLGGADWAINAAIFTAKTDLALDAVDIMRAGTLVVNDSTDFRVDAIPFGGGGTAGLGREGVRSAIEGMAESAMFTFKKTPAVRRT